MPDETDNEFLLYLIRYGKEYPNFSEYLMRKRQYFWSKKEIAEINMDLTNTFKAGINSLADTFGCEYDSLSGQTRVTRDKTTKRLQSVYDG